LIGIAGHFGRIELARPVFHPGACLLCRHSILFSLSRSRIGFLVKMKNVLECICVNCGSGYSELPYFPYSLRTPHSQILRTLQIPWRTPNPHRCVILDNEVLFRPIHGCSRDFSHLTATICQSSVHRACFGTRSSQCHLSFPVPH
jgi:hypothetical protein